MIALVAAVAVVIAANPTTDTVGYSAEGRPIATKTAGARPSVLVFGCIHGDECAATRIVKLFWRAASPPAAADVMTVRNLDPDGYVLGTRLNANGVDLNRNFASDWRQIGAPGDPEHSGYFPFSEPETLIARKLIRAVRPDITIWFHQQADPLVRAWGPSIPAARSYARLAGEHFVALPWMDGTAPNWQNHAFPGTTSFVVELPEAGRIHAGRHARAIRELAVRN